MEPNMTDRLQRIAEVSRFAAVHPRSLSLYRNSPFTAKIEQLWSDSAEFDETPYAGKIDLAFVDGSHSYDYVKNDTEKVLRMMTPNGVVLWHDYYPQYFDVAKYLEEHRTNLAHIETTSMVVLRKAGAALRSWNR
jgi:predicted O-methyltransferase YrrM